MKKLLLILAICVISNSCGVKNIADGNWKKFHGYDADIELNFDEARTVNIVKINFLANPRQNITIPTTVRVYAFPIDAAPDMPETVVRTFKIDDETSVSSNKTFTKVFELNKLKTKYLRIVAENPDAESWIYIGEIIIE